MRISDWSSDVCSSDLVGRADARGRVREQRAGTEDVGDLRRAVLQRVLQIFGRVVVVGLDLLAALLIALGEALLDGTVSSHLLDDPGHIVVALGDLDHTVGEAAVVDLRSEEHTSELQSLMRISYAVFCLKKK